MALGGAQDPIALARGGTTEPRYRPILKWAGGKSRLVARIVAHLPSQVQTYFEPFVGSGAVFFALASERRFQRAVLADINAELVDVYRGVRKDVSGVIKLLEGYRRRHDEEAYYRTRERDPRTLDLIERAARLIYLNKTGYNGLYRVNRSGRFNVPFGRYDNPAICDEPRLRAAAEALRRRGVSIETGDFQSVCESAARGDAVYFDPPYVPASRTANFTAYHRDSFGPDEHARLAQSFKRLTRKKVATVLSNSDAEATRRLYRAPGIALDRVLVTRPINSKSSARGNVAELLVSNRRAILK
jgi:DNA adenine methylase